MSDSNSNIALPETQNLPISANNHEKTAPPVQQQENKDIQSDNSSVSFKQSWYHRLKKRLFPGVDVPNTDFDNAVNKIRELELCVIKGCDEIFRLSTVMDQLFQVSNETNKTFAEMNVIATSSAVQMVAGSLSDKTQTGLTELHQQLQEHLKQYQSFFEDTIDRNIIKAEADYYKTKFVAINADRLRRIRAGEGGQKQQQEDSERDRNKFTRNKEKLQQAVQRLERVEKALLDKMRLYISQSHYIFTKNTKTLNDIEKEFCNSYSNLLLERFK